MNVKSNSEFNGEFSLGLVLLCFSIFVIIESIQMPLRGNSGFVMSPGFVPFLLGVALFLLSGGHTINAWSKGGSLHLWQWLRNSVNDNENKRFFSLLVTIMIYIIVLLGRVHFSIATFLFHLSIFYYLKVGTVMMIIFYTVIATVLVAFVLPTFFEMPLP
jgi:hypothetical protein